jgi:hypothetical protein
MITTRISNQVEQVGSLTDPQAAEFITGICYHAEKKLLLTAGCDGNCRLWQLKFDQESIETSYVNEFASPDDTLCVGLSFSPSGNRFTFSKLSNFYLVQLGPNSQDRDDDMEYDHIISYSELSPSVVSSVVWTSDSTLRVYTHHASLYSFSINDDVQLNLEKDETASLTAFLSTCVKQSLVKREKMDDDDDEITSFHESTSFLIYGVLSSFHNLSDVIFFVPGPSPFATYRPEATHNIYVAYQPLYSEFLPVEKVVDILCKDLKAPGFLFDSTTTNILWDLLCDPYCSSSSDLLQRVHAIVDVLEEKITTLPVDTPGTRLNDSCHIKFRQFIVFIWESTRRLWFDKENSDEYINVISNTRDAIFAFAMDIIISSLFDRTPDEGMAWDEENLSILARYLHCHGQSGEMLHLVLKLLNNESAQRWEEVLTSGTDSLCGICDGKIQLDSLFLATCENGHAWRKNMQLTIARCGLGLQVLDAPNCFNCTRCRINIKSYSGSHGPILDLLSSMNDECLYCGSQVTCPNFKIRRD